MISSVNITGYAYNLINTSSEKTSADFESIMSQKTSQQSSDAKTKTQDTQKTDETDKRKDESVKSSDRKDEDTKVKSDKTEDTQRSDNTDEPKDTADTENKADDKSTDAEKNPDAKKVDEKEPSEIKEEGETEAIEEIAQLIGVDVQTVVDALESLDISVEDLADGTNLVAFMQKVMDVDNAADLISIENITDIMSGVQETAEKFAEFSNSLMSVEAKEQSAQAAENYAQIVSEKSAEKRDDIKNDIQLESTQGDEQAPQTLEQKIEVVSNEKSFANLFSNQNGSQDSQSEQQMPENFSVQTMVGNINKAINNTVIKTEGTRNVNTADVVNQIIEKIKVSSSSEVTEMNIKLKPEELGELTLRIISDNGSITAQFTAESQRVKEIIESNFDLLKDALAQSGVEVSELEVNVGDGSQDRSAFDDYNDFTDRAFYPEIGEEAEIQAAVLTESEVLQSNVSYMA